MKKTLLLSFVLAALLLAPAGARAGDWVLSGLTISIGADAPTYRPQPVHYDRGRRHGRYDCREYRRHRRPHVERHNRGHFRHRDVRRRRLADRRVVVRPGGTVVIRDGRRW